VKTNKTNTEKKSQDTDFVFPCGDFQKMAEMMKNCCPHESGANNCCSMMRKMMGHGKGGQAKKEEETQKPPLGGENG
jgi:hypothetical protein